MRTVSGHRDWEATACPGGALYAQLPTIRADVAARMAGSPSPGPVPGTAPAAITSGSCTGTTCTFAGSGVGTLTWTLGNGKTATGSPVSATYTAKGSYTVMLTDGQAPATTASRTVTCSTVKRKLSCTT